MSCKRTVQSFRPIEVKITCIDKKTIEVIEKTAVTAINQKLEKLNSLFKNLNVYCVEDVLVVNDRYGVCKDFPEIAQAFGFEVKQTECGLKGRSYVLQDELIGIIRMLDPQFTPEKFANSVATAELISLIKNEIKKNKSDLKLTEILAAVKTQGYYSVTGKQQITTTYYDNSVIGQKEGKVISNREQVEAMLNGYANNAKVSLERANENLRDGTVKLLCSRARQMGYAVKEERNGKQVQLVLVRVE